MILTLNVVSTNFSTETPLVVDASGIVINADTNSSGASVLVSTVDNGCPAVITVTQANYHPYTITIDNVYSTDKTIEVIMVSNVTDIEDANYLRPRPSLYTFSDPCNFCIDAYSATSYGGEMCWYVNNELYKKNVSKVVSCFCNTGDYQIKMRSQTSQSVVEYPGCPPVVTKLWDNQFATIQTGNTVSGVIDELSVYLALDLVTNVTVSEYRVGIDLVATSEISPLVDSDSCLYSRDEEVTITPTITLNRLGADPALHTITWNVIDPEGVTVTLLQSVFPIDIDPSLYTVTFPLTKLGVYEVTVTVDDLDCGTEFVQTMSVETCNFVYLKYLECGSFEVQNRSSDTPFTYSVSDIASSTPVEEGTLEPGKAMQLTFTDVSMFIMSVTYTRNGLIVTEEYVMSNYCQIERCLSDYIEDLLCAPTERCTPCPPESDLKQMFLFYNTYFMKIHKLFNTNSYFAALDEEGLSEITTLKQLMDKMLGFCGRTSCTDSVNSAFQSSYITQGPYDYVGKGTSLDPGCKTCN